MTKVVKLKNGSEEAEPVVKATMFSLERLFAEDPIAAYDLVMKCRNQSYSIFEETEKTLVDLGLLRRHTIDMTTSVHNSIRNIVLSGTEGEDLDMRLTNPIAESKKAKSQ